ncbi:MAG TPA: PEP-CTERM sorting domain-containing protein [Chthoniobacteraceae bacterium]|nr:PEP-CTERM sorting domain-containing protein [Chthoniobacteraceae bacterium]
MSITLFSNFRRRLVVAVTAGVFVFGFGHAAHSAVVGYSFDAIVVTTSMDIDPGSIYPDDRFAIHFSLEDSTEIEIQEFPGDVIGFFAGPATVISLEAVPGNFGDYTGGNVLLSSSYIRIREGAGSLELTMTISDTEPVQTSFGPGTLNTVQFSFELGDFTLVEGDTLAKYLALMIAPQSNFSGRFDVFADGELLDVNVAPIPEPGTFVLIGMAGAALLLLKRRRR